LMNQHPTVDFGVVTLCRALGLPAGSALALLGVGRVVGWIAHALEQYQEGRLIRPRARYAGELPRG
jgi:citrate synthase